MNIKISSIHFNADQKLEEFIEEKVSKLNHFGEDLLSAEVSLSLERPVGKNYDSKVVKIKLKGKDKEYFAEKMSETFESSADEAVDALKNQIVKHKDKKSKKN